VVYLVVTRNIAPGKMNEYKAFYTGETVLGDIYKKIGYNMVASWSTLIGNPDEVITVFAWESMAAYDKARAAARKNKEYLAASTKLRAISTSISRLMEANEWSPLK
jgi:hypothetical protein